MNIHVYGLYAHTDSRALQKLSVRFGEVAEAKIVTYKSSGKSIGLGFTGMPNGAAVREVITKWKGASPDGRTVVNYSMVQKQTEHKEIS